jgi:hypothetical protein
MEFAMVLDTSVAISIGSTAMKYANKKHVESLAYVVLCLLSCISTGCTTSEVVVAHSVALTSAVERVPEDGLLDVAIVAFDPGVPDGEIDKGAGVPADVHPEADGTPVASH